MGDLNIIVTMAGFGRRFLDAGYEVPKYRIVAHDRSLFAWSMLSLRQFIEAGASFVFVVRAADQADAFIRAQASELGMASCTIHSLSEPTDGQATSALLAAEALRDRGAPMLIYNIDTFVHPSSLRPAAVRGDGWIPCFEAHGDAWSFAACDSEGRVHEVREKQRISPHATVGLYYFSSFALFEETYADYYRDAQNMERGERYVAPLYNRLIQQQRAVYIEQVPASAVIPLGTPDDLMRFLAQPPRPL